MRALDARTLASLAERLKKTHTPEGLAAAVEAAAKASALEIELAALKAKHQAGSRLEAVLMELDEERGKNMVAQAALRSVQQLLEEGEVEAAKEEVAKIVPAPSDDTGEET